LSQHDPDLNKFERRETIDVQISQYINMR